MKFTFRTATEDDDNLINGTSAEAYHANLSKEMKALLEACNKLTADSTEKKDTLILTLTSGKERTQLKTSLTKNERHIKPYVFRLQNRGVSTLLVSKVTALSAGADLPTPETGEGRSAAASLEAAAA